MRDVLPEEIPAWRYLEETAARVARARGYREIRPVLLEETELFTRSVGEVTDIVEKEMFTLQRGEHSFTLRPEGTAGIVRAYLQAGYAKSAPVQKLFNIGPMWRYERPQKGRERMFTQFDVEAIGSLDPRLDAEVIHLAASFFEELGVEGLEVRVNSMGAGADRDRYREAMRDYMRPKLAEYSEESQARFERNVLRVLDSKDPRDVELNAGAPPLLEFLSDENREHFEEVQAQLGKLERTVIVDPSIVRGMDYYTRTVFEVKYPPFGARSTLCGGGRYDDLVAELGGPELGAVGFAVGFSGTLITLEELGLLGERTEAPDRRVRRRHRRGGRARGPGRGRGAPARGHLGRVRPRRSRNEGPAQAGRTRRTPTGGRARPRRARARRVSAQGSRRGRAARGRADGAGQRGARGPGVRGGLSGPMHGAGGRTGVFGGSFDPVHTGHLHAARVARERFGLDRILWVPAARPPHKPDRVLADADARCAMLELAVADEPGWEVWRGELGREGPSYTIDTVRELRAGGLTDLHLVIGDDNLAGLGAWRELEALLELVQPIVVRRGERDDRLLEAVAAKLPEHLAEKLRRGACDLPPVEVSATELRELLVRGADPGDRVPPGVREYLLEHAVYGAESETRP